MEKCDVESITTTRDARDNYSIDINGQVDLAEYIRTYTLVDGERLENYWTKDLVWESADESIATVAVGEEEGGLVTGIATGETVVTVYPQGKPENKLTFNITVTGNTVEPRVTGLRLSDNALSLERGEEATITLTVEPYNLPESVLSGLTFKWSESNATIRVTPSADGRSATIKALKSGNSTVSVQVENTYVNASCSVNVKEEFYVDGVYLRSYTGRGDENGIVEIPDDLGISYIYPMAFYDNDYIKGIRIPEGVMYIMRAGIYGCENLEWVELPSTLEQVQTFGLAWNPNLKTIYGLEYVTSIGSRAFINDTSLVLGPDDLSSTTFIQNMAFYGCDSITSVDLSKVGVVGQAAFAFCSGLTEVTIPSHTTLEDSAFQSCPSLERVVIHSSNIGNAAFAYCTALESVTFTGDVKSIGIQAFYGCSALRDVQFLKTAYNIESLAFGYCSSLESFTLPAGLEILGSQVLLGTNVETVKISKDARITETGVAAFNASSVTAFEVEAGNKYFTSADGVLYDKTALQTRRISRGQNGEPLHRPRQRARHRRKRIRLCARRRNGRPQQRRGHRGVRLRKFRQYALQRRQHDQLALHRLHDGRRQPDSRTCASSATTPSRSPSSRRCPSPTRPRRSAAMPSPSRPVWAARSRCPHR